MHETPDGAAEAPRWAAPFGFAQKVDVVHHRCRAGQVCDQRPRGGVYATIANAWRGLPGAEVCRRDHRTVP